MIYRFVIGSEEAENFKLVVAADSDDTFMNLRNTILKACNYSLDQMDSFYICDDDWNKEKEITAMDMGMEESDEDIWLMDETRLENLIEDEGQKMKFVFDYMTDRYFFMKLKEAIPGQSLDEPVCELKQGTPPEEARELNDFMAPAQAAKTTDISLEAFDDEFESTGYNDDEIADYGEMDSSELY